MVNLKKIVETIAIIFITFGIVRASLYVEAITKEKETLQPSFIVIADIPNIRLVETWQGERIETSGWGVLLQNIGSQASNVNITIPTQEYEMPIAYYDTIGSKEVFGIYVSNSNPRPDFYVYGFEYPEISIKYDGGQQTITIYESEE